MLGALAVLSTVSLPAQDGLDMSFKGFVDTYHAMRIEAPNDWMSSRTRVRGEFRLEKGNSGAFVSANLIYNALLNDQSGFQLREAYLYWGNSDWDIRAGNQIITWGVADGLRVTDLISPMDYTEFQAQDYDDIRVPVGALRARYIHNAWSLEAVLVPVPEFYKIPTDPANPWSMGPLPPEVRPDKTIENMEYGGRFSCFLGGIDFSLMALRTWSKIPELVVDHLGYHRITAVGGDLSIPFGQFVFRGELADCIDDDGIHQGNALVGFDYFYAEEGMFLAYKDNSEIWLKLKYNF